LQVKNLKIIKIMFAIIQFSGRISMCCIGWGNSGAPKTQISVISKIDGGYVYERTHDE
jgi:hypothetical protein